MNIKIIKKLTFGYLKNGFQKEKIMEKSIRFKYKKKSFKLKSIDAEMFSARASFMSFIFLRGGGG